MNAERVAIDNNFVWLPGIAAGPAVASPFSLGGHPQSNVQLPLPAPPALLTPAPPGPGGCSFVTTGGRTFFLLPLSLQLFDGVGTERDGICT